MRTAIADLTPAVGVRAACEAFDFPRTSFYRKGFGVVFPAAAAGHRRSRKGDLILDKADHASVPVVPTRAG